MAERFPTGAEEILERRLENVVLRLDKKREELLALYVLQPMLRRLVCGSAMVGSVFHRRRRKTMV